MSSNILNSSAVFVLDVVRGERSSRGSRTCTHHVDSGSAHSLIDILQQSYLPIGMSSTGMAENRQSVSKRPVLTLQRVSLLQHVRASQPDPAMEQRLPQATSNFPSVQTVAQLCHPLTGENIRIRVFSRPWPSIPNRLETDFGTRSSQDGR